MWCLWSNFSSVPPNPYILCAGVCSLFVLLFANPSAKRVFLPLISGLFVFNKVNLKAIYISREVSESACPQSDSSGHKRLITLLVSM